MRLRQRLYTILERPAPDDRLASGWSAGLAILIVVNVIAVIAETVAWVEHRYRPLLVGLQTISLFVFSVEYVLRLWVITCDPRYDRPLLGRLRYAATPGALVHLLSIVPSLFATGVDLRFIRIGRLGRLMRALRLARYSQALALVARVLQRRREELSAAVGLIALLLLVAASLMYFAEHDAQPEAFSSIPSALWWAVMTVTTVGYGDVYPVTVFGRLLAGLIALLGIGAFALPTSILGAGFLAEFAERQSASRSGAVQRADPLDENSEHP